MREKDLPIDLTKHKVYSKNAKKCVQKLLRRYYGKQTAAELWEKVQLQYCEYLKGEPALKDLKITTSIYDPILIFAWYVVIPDKPALAEVQQDIYQSFFGSFDLMGKIFDLNRKPDNKLASKIFQKSNGQLLLRQGERHHPLQLYPMPQCGVCKTASHGGRAAGSVQLRPSGHAGNPRGFDPGRDLRDGRPLRLLHRGEQESHRRRIRPRCGGKRPAAQCEKGIKMIILQLALYCALFTLMVKIGVGNNALNGLYFYPKPVQEKVYELGLIDRETVAGKRKRFMTAFFAVMAAALILIIRVWNGVQSFLPAYLQALLFLEVMNWYDGIVIDRLWVGHSRFWIIPGTEEIPFVQTWPQVLKKRGILTLIWIAGAAIVAGIIVLLF